ncbi:MAG: hypothetical protein JRD05_00565 [Deltaproteobacteria bacterium]|nr:hypothetical protein [Deltaproteobacteria bacterium]
MGRRQNRKKTRRVKMKAAQPRMVACGKRINGIEDRKVDYNSLSKIGKAALDNVIQFTGRTKEEILKTG